VNGPVRVALADDQALVRAGFRLILDAQPDIEVVAEASDGEELLRAAVGSRPDVILMDVRMPILDGIEATKRLMNRPDNRARVLILTTFDVDSYVLEALRAGASGFLLKDVTREELVHAVRVIAAGEALLSPTVTRRMISRFADLPDENAEHGSGAAQLVALTGREREVLTLIASGLSNSEIAARLVVSENTVKTHVSNVLSKMHLRDRVHAVILAYEAGLVRPQRT